MKLYLLRSRDNRIGYDCAYGFVIRAINAQRARAIAQTHGGDETRDYANYPNTVPFWTDPKKTTCKELTAGTKEEVVIRDFHAG